MRAFTHLFAGLFIFQLLKCNAITQFDSSFAASQFSSMSTFLGSSWVFVGEMVALFGTKWPVALKSDDFDGAVRVLDDLVSVNDTLHYLWTLQVPIYTEQLPFQFLMLGLINGGFYSYLSDSNTCAGSINILKNENQTCPPSRVGKRSIPKGQKDDSKHCLLYYSGAPHMSCVSGQITGEPSWDNEACGTWYDPRVRPWYIEAIKSSKGVWTGPYRSVVENALMVTTSRRIVSAEGVVLGVAAISSRLSGLESRLASATSVDPSTYLIFVVDIRGVSVASSIAGLSDLQNAKSSSNKIVAAAATFVESTLNGWIAAATSSKVRSMAVAGMGLYWVKVDEYKDGLNWFFVTVETINCDPGYYSSLQKGPSQLGAPSIWTVMTGEECIPCPDGMVCNGKQWLPYPEPSKWVMTQGNTVSFLSRPLECNQKSNCVGVQSQALLNCFQSVVEFANCTEAAFSGMCRLGSYGSLCGSCSSGYSMAGSQGCVACSGGNKLPIPFAYAALLVLAVTALIAMIGLRKLPEPVLRTIHSIIPANGELKVLWSTFQILSCIPDSVNVQFPLIYSSWLNTINYWVMFKFLSFECLSGSSNFWSRVLFASIAPLVLMGVLGAAFLIAKKKGLVQTQQKLAYGFLFTSYAILPTVSKMHIEALYCQTFLNRRMFFLRVATNISCKSSSYKSFRAAVIIFLGAYQSIPILWFVLLWRNRHRINPSIDRNQRLIPQDRLNNPKISHLVFLFADYKPDKYLFEVVDMYRRIFFVAFLPLTGSGPTRAIIGSYIAAVCVAYYREASAFINDRTSILCSVAVFQILITFVGALFFVTSNSIDNFSLALILLLSNLCLLVLMIAWSFDRFRRDRVKQSWRRELSKTAKDLIKKIMGKTSTGASNETDVDPQSGPSKALDISLRRYLVNPQDIVLVNRLGAGSFGEVFRGTYLGQKCVVKSLLSVTEKSLREFRAEMLLTANLRHPNIIIMFGCCWKRNLVCLVLEYASNGTLEDFVLRNSQLTWADPLLKLSLDTARGMAYLHAREYWDEASGATQRCILHRDLKGENILITSFIAAKISDFGTSRVRDENRAATMTSVGTPLYCAPELARGEQYDESVDVYSFGLVLLSMAIEGPLIDFMLKAWSRNKRPGKESMPKSPTRMLLDIAENGWRPLDAAQLENAPSSVEKLIARCYAHDAWLRPTFNEVIAELSGPCKEEIDSDGHFLQCEVWRSNELSPISDSMTPTQPIICVGASPLLGVELTQVANNSDSDGDRGGRRASGVFESPQLRALKARRPPNNRDDPVQREGAFKV